MGGVSLSAIKRLPTQTAESPVDVAGHCQVVPAAYALIISGGQS